MADVHMPFHIRLRAAIEAHGPANQPFGAKVDGLYRYMNRRGIRGADATSRTLRRWLAGKGYPPDHWCDMAAAYLGVRPQCIRPTPRERRGEAVAAAAPTRVPAVLAPDDRWAAETVYIVGGGPSAGRYDLTHLHQHGIVIAVNDSATALPDADVLFSASPTWVQNRQEFIRSFQNQVVVGISCGSRKAPIRWRLPGWVAVFPSKWRGRGAQRGGNSGQEAIYWAADAGARKIVLIGFDMHEHDPRNWHHGYEWAPAKELQAGWNYPLWARNLEETAHEMRERGIDVWNANLDSAVRCFPFCDLPVPSEGEELP